MNVARSWRGLSTICAGPWQREWPNSGIAPPHVIEALLNHLSGHKRGVAGVYNRSSYERVTRNALAAWADYINSKIVGAERKVIPIGERS
jgi:hypothetical protein